MTRIQQKLSGQFRIHWMPSQLLLNHTSFLIENEDVRVLRVIIQPGEKEPMHTHRWKSVMYVEKPARIRYYLPDGKIAFESPPGSVGSGPPEPNWMGPEGLHAVENIDTVTFEALRVELKN